LVCAASVHALDEPAPPLLTLISQLDPAETGRNKSDVWGWVDPSSGKEYAVVGEWKGSRVYIIDVSEAGNPQIASTITGIPSQDVKTWDNYLYAVTGAANAGPINEGQIYDISDPTNPVFVRSMPSGHNLTIVDGYMYKSVLGMTIYDLNADPSNPQFRWWDGSSTTGHDATVVGNILYDFRGTGGTRIYNISNPFSPIEMGRLARVETTIAYHHNGAPTEDGNYLFISDELGAATAPDITVWDISDPQTFVEVGGFTDPDATVHNVFVVGDLLIASFYAAGVRVFDISTPWNPILLDTYDTAPGISGNGVFAGCWGVYPFAPSGVIYASDIQNGLYLFSFPAFTSAVVIAAFDAVYEDGAVRLAWEIGSADDLAGFRVYRSLDAEAGFVQINQGLLPADGAYEFRDTDVHAGTSYWYRLGATDRDGEFLSRSRKVVVPELEFVLTQNYPNPFNPTTTIDYVVTEAGPVSLVVYNATGQRIRTLVAGSQSEGPHSVVWDGLTEDGAMAASGAYFYRLTTTRHTETKRMVLLK
jgi:choice-of-anchor B domain-containing protein